MKKNNSDVELLNYDRQKLDKFVEKVNQMKKTDKMDLSSDEDLSIAIMNLISIEEHFFFTGAKTEKTEYFDLIKEVRQIRKDLLKKIIKEYEGEIWCISKHLLASSMRLMEVGAKRLDKENKEEAYELFSKAFKLYSLFWGINLKVVDLKNIKKIDDQAINKHDQDKIGFFNKLSQIIKKTINCCIE